MVGYHRYTDEEHEFLRNFIPGHTYKEILAAYNEKFDEPITIPKIQSYMGNHKINNGLTGRFPKGHVPANKGTHPPTVGRMGETQFKKGRIPPNIKPIGYERITKDGYIEVKVKMRPSSPVCRDSFVLKHILVWEKENGPIPEGYTIIFLDRNKQNCSIENLALVSRAELLQMTIKGLRSTNPQLTETGILIARAGVVSAKEKKNIRKKKSKSKNESEWQ